MKLGVLSDEPRELLLALAALEDALVMSEIADPACAPTTEPSTAVATSVWSLPPELSRVPAPVAPPAEGVEPEALAAPPLADEDEGADPAALCCPAACAREEKPLESEVTAGELLAPWPMAGRPGMLVRASTSALICMAELSAPAIEELPLEPAALAAESAPVNVPV